ncbi:NAD-dependent epimerase/dehydratase family protein [Pseudonocardia hispaniensis]|uniref:NAD-dependent epimerase/dehydratase family protein n=1 Tax=Pseudonocardia hispaniensis TaxID=904933 RepID=A0ABW1J271_9PSEU
MGTARVLLFGASGFLGRPLAAALTGDPRVGALIRVGRQERADQGRRRHDLVTGTPEQLGRLLQDVEPDVVINATGRMSGGYAALVEANVLTTARLLDAIAMHAPTARLVVLGSAAEYGVVRAGEPVAEDSPTSPASDYGVTKLTATRLAWLAAAEGRVEAVVLRVFNPIGAGTPDTTVLGRAVTDMRRAMEHGDDHIRLGPLGAYRDFVDVRDVASAITAAALADEVAAPVLNVGRGVAVPTRAVIELLAEVAGFSGQIRESAPAPDRSRTVDWIAADTSLINRSFGWVPAHDLRSALEAAWTTAGRDTALVRARSAPSP